MDDKYLTCFVAVFWSVITFCGNYAVFQNIYAQAQSYAFAETEGTVLTSRVEGNSEGQNGISYSPEISFAYTVNQQQYQGEAVRFGQGPTTRTHARDWVDRMQKGKGVTVYFDESDPNRSVLLKGLQGFDLLLIVFIVPFNVVMICFFIGIAIEYRSGADQEEAYRRLLESPLGSAARWLVMSCFAGAFLAGSTTWLNPSIGFMSVIVFVVAVLALCGYFSGLKNCDTTVNAS